MWSSPSSISASFEGEFLDDSRTGGQDNAKSRRQQTVIPSMIEPLLSFPSVEETKLWDIPARIFSVVGILRHVEESATKILYEIEDQTGTITALKWLEANKTPSNGNIQINTYVRIIGLLREQNQKRHLLILKMYPLENLNELTNHLLEVSYAMVKAKAMSKETNEMEDVKDATSYQGYVVDSYYGMTADQTLVYKIIREKNDTEFGIERAEIKAKVPQNILSDMDNILEFLVSEGHIYSTCTDNHFKTT